MQYIENKADNNKHNKNIIPFIPEGDFYFAKGVEALKKRKFDKSIKWLQKAVEQVPKDPLYQCQMSIVYTEIGAFHKAIQVLTNVLQSTGDKYVDCYYLLANNYAHLGLLHDAKKYAEAYLNKEPNGDFSEEAKSLLEIIDIDEDNEWGSLVEEDELLIYQETIFHHMEFMEWSKALPFIEEMQSLFPEYTLTKHDYSQALFFTGSQDEAIRMELELLEEDQNSLYSHANLAVFYDKQGRKDLCKEHICVLRNVYPIHNQQKLRIAATFARTGFYREALSRFRQLPKGSVKNHPSYYRWYSTALYETGQIKKALKLWAEGCNRHQKLSNEVVPWNQ